MSFRITGAGDIEIKAAFDVSDQLGGIAEIIFCGYMGIFISTEGENVFNPRILVFGQTVVDLIFGAGDAGDMRKGGNMIFFLE